MSRRQKVRRSKLNRTRVGKIGRKQLEDEATRILAGKPVNVDRIGRRHMTEEDLQRLIGRRGV